MMVVDQKGKEITIGARIWVPARPDPLCPELFDESTKKGGFSSYKGEVLAVSERVVTLRDLENGGTRSTRPEFCRVQSGRLLKDRLLERAERKRRAKSNQKPKRIKRK